MNITDHHDGLGLNDLVEIVASDEDANGVAHHFKFERHVPEGLNLAGFIQFQKGPRNEAGSTPGVTTDAVLVMLIHVLKGFNDTPLKSRETALMITHLEEALHWSQARARERARRGVLGKTKA